MCLTYINMFNFPDNPMENVLSSLQMKKLERSDNLPKVKASVLMKAVPAAVNSPPTPKFNVIPCTSYFPQNLVAEFLIRLPSTWSFRDPARLHRKALPPSRFLQSSPLSPWVKRGSRTAGQGLGSHPWMWCISLLPLATNSTV